VSVALVRQYIRCMAVLYCNLWSVWFCLILSKLSKKNTIFGEKIIFSFSLKDSSETFLILTVQRNVS